MAGEAILNEVEPQKHKWMHVSPKSLVIECEECGDQLNESNEFDECYGYDPYIGEEHS